MRAYDMLTTMPAGFWEQPDRASRALFAGTIKHHQWSQVCWDAALDMIKDHQCSHVCWAVLWTQ